MVKGGGKRAVDRARAEDDRLATQRKLVEIREGIAAVASSAADADMARVFEALDRHAAQVELLAQAEAAWHPTAVRAAKESAHATFRKAVAAARERNAVEAAATVWLDEINRLNAGLRAAEVQIRRERETAVALLSEIDSLCIEAGSSRARADSAIESHRTARLELAAALGLPADEVPDEARAAAAVVVPGLTPALSVTSPAGEAAVVAVNTAAAAAADEPVVAATADERSPAHEPEPPRGLRPGPEGVDPDARPRQALLALLLDGEDAIDRIAHRLAAGDGDDPLVWQTWLRGLVAALTIEAAAAGELEFPHADPFWGLFTTTDARAIARALAALGFINDGAGGFIGDRLPAQHDLVAAAGSAGLLPVRVRHFPTADEIPNLYRGVRVATETLLADRAPNLTLGEVIGLLGRRAEPLANLWNEWPRVREVLLAPES
jgi:hypothetical protein